MSEIKKCFPSRWGADGRIVETDFSQLEIVGVAFLSGDENLKDDIRKGRDLHCMSASFLFNTPYEDIYKAVKVDNDPVWQKRRKAAKSPSFQLQYGAGYKSIAKKCGLTEKQAKTFVENYYGRYKQLKEWQEENIREVNRNRQITDRRSPAGYQLGIGYLHGPTGRAYAFMEEEAPDFLKEKGTMTSFQPTQIKNYPSQGFATGDLVPMCLGELYYELKANEQLRDMALLVNTVHDSVILDVHTSVQECAISTVEKVLTSAPHYLKMQFGIEFDLPINVETSVGLTWGETA